VIQHLQDQSAAFFIQHRLTQVPPVTPYFTLDTRAKRKKQSLNASIRNGAPDLRRRLPGRRSLDKLASIPV
jgi:hypothetical protein